MTKRNKQLDVPAQEDPEQQCPFSLVPDNIIWDILHWSRPDDQDQYIWLWLCCISATCKDFRRLVRLERKDTSTLLPKVFKLCRDIRYFLIEGLHVHDNELILSPYPCILRYKLIDTIRRSDWMGSNITCVHSCDSGAMLEWRGILSQDVSQVMKAFLTGPYLPKLLEVKFCTHYERENSVVNQVLCNLAQAHSDLTSLCLMGRGDGNPSPAPHTLATLSKSLQHLKRAGIGDSTQSMSRTPWLRDEHLMAFMANLNPNLESLVLDFKRMSDAGYASVEAHCPNLTSLTIRAWNITRFRLASVIRSKRFLSSLDLSYCNGHFDMTAVFDAIVEAQLQLKTFRAQCCRWLNDDNLMRLLEGQIEACNGHVLLTTIGIRDTGCTLDGLRAVLVRRRETKPDLRLTIELFNEAWVAQEAEAWQSLISEFPEVSFRSITWSPYNYTW